MSHIPDLYQFAGPFSPPADLFSPEANAAAAVRYVQARYGPPREPDWQWPEPWLGQVCLRPEHPRVTYKTIMPATSPYARNAPVDREERIVRDGRPWSVRRLLGRRHV